MSLNPRPSHRNKIYGVLAILMAIGMGLSWAYFQSQQVPEYYQRAQAQVAERSKQQIQQPRSDSGNTPSTGSEKKLQGLLTLLNGNGANQAAADEWLTQLTGETPTTRIHEVFGEDDINAWLTGELLRKFQHCLPPGVSEPQVDFANGGGLVGFRYEQSGLKGVVTMDVDVAMTGKGSQLGIRFRKISVGSLPLPVGKVLDLISEAAMRSQGRNYKGPEVVKWTKQGGDHMALLPGSGPGGGYFNMLESFSLRDGEVELTIKRQPSSRR
jgi:hypothetical protein